MRVKIFYTMVVLMALGNAQFAFAGATQVDALVEKLVEKGILTKSEGIELKAEIAADEKIVRDESLKSSLPGWVQKLKLKGDLRLRYQQEKKETDVKERNRARFRYRLGLETDINDQVNVGAGLASGANADPRSTNQTFQDSFSHKPVNLDYAYAQYQPAKWVKMVGGKFLRPDYLWNATDLLWDSDVNPEGGAIHFEHLLFPPTTGYFNTGFLVQDEITTASNSKTDPYIHYAQGGLKWKGGNFDANLAGTYYEFAGIKGSCPEWGKATNTGITSVSSTGACTGALTYDYDSLGASAQFGMMNPFGEFPLEKISLIGDYIQNISESVPSNQDTGWSLGIQFGDAKLAVPGNWQSKYIYASLQKDAFVDFLPDSDRLGGGTNTKSHEIILEYMWKKNVLLGIDYYLSDNLSGSSNIERLLQADVVLKF